MTDVPHVEIRFTPRAVDNLQMIHAHCVGVLGTDRADNDTDRIRDIIEMIRRNPFLGSSRAEVGPGIRAIPAEQHIVFYSFVNNTVIIRTILHSGMDIPASLARNREPAHGDDAVPRLGRAN
jgi:plasmid stabilization system protein ParE